MENIIPMRQCRWHVLKSKLKNETLSVLTCILWVWRYLIPNWFSVSVKHGLKVGGKDSHRHPSVSQPQPLVSVQRHIHHQPNQQVKLCQTELIIKAAPPNQQLHALVRTTCLTSLLLSAIQANNKEKTSLSQRDLQMHCISLQWLKNAALTGATTAWNDAPLC